MRPATVAVLLGLLLIGRTTVSTGQDAGTLAWPVTFTDTAQKAGLVHATVYGGLDRKRFIIETNGSGVALVDVDRDLDLVARHFLDLGVDAHCVLATREVLVGEVLLDLVEHGLVEGLAGREADVAQRLLQVLGLDVLVALDLEALDRGPLEHHHQERVAIATQLHLAEEVALVAHRKPAR